MNNPSLATPGSGLRPAEKPGGAGGSPRPPVLSAASSSPGPPTMQSSPAPPTRTSSPSPPRSTSSPSPPSSRSLPPRPHTMSSNGLPVRDVVAVGAQDAAHGRRSRHTPSMEGVGSPVHMISTASHTRSAGAGGLRRRRLLRRGGRRHGPRPCRRLASGAALTGAAITVGAGVACTAGVGSAAAVGAGAASPPRSQCPRRSAWGGRGLRSHGRLRGRRRDRRGRRRGSRRRGRHRPFARTGSHRVRDERPRLLPLVSARGRGKDQHSRAGDRNHMPNATVRPNRIARAESRIPYWRSNPGRHAGSARGKPRSRQGACCRSRRRGRSIRAPEDGYRKLGQSWRLRPRRHSVCMLMRRTQTQYRRARARPSPPP